MSTYSIRCRNSKCRHRRVSKKHPDEYRVIPRCPCCGERKGWRIEQRQYNQRNLCRCMGVAGKDGEFPHRKGRHPMCEHHPQGFYNQAKRAGVKDEDIPLEYLGRQIEDDELCPF